MRVLYCIDSLAIGGAERSLVAMAPHLVSGGIDLHLAVLRRTEPNLEPTMARSGAVVHHLDRATSRRAAIGELRHLVASIDPDHVHTTLAEADLIGRVAARLSRTTVSSSLVNVSYGAEHRASVPHQWRLHAFQAADIVTARLTSRLHAVSESVRQTMSTRLRYPLDQIDVVPRGRDFSRYPSWSPASRSSARLALGGNPDESWILAVCSHEHRKGLDVLIEAFADAARSKPDLRLVVLGRDGSATALLKTLAREAGVEDRVRWMEPVDDVGAVLAASDVFALPSRREGFPGALLEALAVGLPVVASDIDPITEMIGAGGPGIRVVPVDDRHALGAGLLAAVDGAPPDRSIGQRYRDTFGLATVSRAMADFMERAAGG
ncbi:glycosyltransferase [Actinospongicola halichondriae]|uniref:glycosyltransferase n=1 Tax=Actinospongicola halichondriae TaxID=3236844 RepID=UPI003D3B6057